MEHKSIPDMFFHTVEKFPNRPAFSWKVDGSYRAINYTEAKARVTRLAAALSCKVGLSQGDRVSIVSFNCFNWALADLGSGCAGLIVVPVYPNIPANQVANILRDAGSRAVFVENDEQLAKIESIFDDLLDLKFVIRMDGPRKEGDPDHVLSLDDLLIEGEEVLSKDPGLPLRMVEGITSEDLFTIIYTSGTTGDPKGAMLTHSNLLANLEAISRAVRVDENDVFLSFLPLSHVYERTAGFYLPMISGSTIAYAESMLTVGDNMPEVNPTIVVTVPRFFEKMRDKVNASFASGSPLKQKICKWAMVVGSRRLREERHGAVSGLTGFQYSVADKLVFKKIRARLGNRMRFFVSGAAPFQPSLGRFFLSAGVVILEGYGLTETSPVIAVNQEETFKFGTVGPPLDNVEVRISDEGEIHVKGPSVMRGYYNKPEATEAAINDDWFHTGDIGYLDNNGYLKITDRLKNIIVTSGGKNVSPQHIENLLTDSPLIDQVLLVGDKRNFISALIVPNYERLQDAAQVSDLKFRSTEDLVDLPEINQLVESEIARVTEGLGNYEKPRKFVLLGREFSIEKGELTPSLKIKRGHVLKLYDKLIESIYRDEIND